MRISIDIEPQIKTPRVTPLEGVSTYAPHGIRVCGVENPQGFGIDERRFVDSNIQLIFALTGIGNVQPQRLRTRITQIRRIFTDAIYSFVSAFICVHLRFEFTGGTT